MLYDIRIILIKNKFMIKKSQIIKNERKSTWESGIVGMLHRANTATTYSLAFVEILEKILIIH